MMDFEQYVVYRPMTVKEESNWGIVTNQVERDAYLAKVASLSQRKADAARRFKVDVLMQVGLVRHPKADKIFSVACRQADKVSYTRKFQRLQAIYEELKVLAELLLD
jgi:hypothetical protein